MARRAEGQLLDGVAVTGLLGKKPAAAESPAYTGIDLQTAVLGVPVPVLIGKDRVVPNLIWYGDFKAKKGKQGGKGGAIGGGGKGGGTVYEYSASVAMALCEKQVASIDRIWRGKAKTTLSALNMTLFNGAQTSAWAYLTSKHPADAFVYGGTAYVAVPNLQMGNSPAIGNFSFEARSTEAGAYGSEVDVDVARLCEIVLTDGRLGVGFADAGDFADARNYCRSLGLIGSLYVREQNPARELLSRLARSANLEWLLSNGVLKLVPLGDETVSGNGYSWTAPTTPLFNLGESDFTAPIEEERSRSSEVKNAVKVEYRDRGKEYNVTPAEAKDEASISQIGPRPSTVVQAHHFKASAPAVLSAQFELARYAKRNGKRLRLDARYSQLEPLDLLTVTEPSSEHDHVPVRIEKVTIDPNGGVTLAVKDYMAGLGSAAAYTFDGGSRPAEDFNAEAPDVAPPYLFEPPPSITDGRRELWIAVNGPGIWGGCEVWISDDGTSYRQIDTIYGGARWGELTTTLPSAASPDETNTPRVDLSVSEGELQSGTEADADALNTLSMIGNELVAYRDADLVAAYTYDLTYLVRGAKGTAITAHSIGAPFVRLDENIAVFEYAEDRVGTTVYLKFVSFNHADGGRQAIEDVTAYSYTLTGQSYVDPLTQIPINVLSGSGVGRTDWPLTSTSSSITLASTTINELGTTVTVGPGTVSGLTPETQYWCYWDHVSGQLVVTSNIATAAVYNADTTLVGGRVGRYRFLGRQYTEKSGGGYPTPPTAPPGSGGGGGGGGFDNASY